MAQIQFSPFLGIDFINLKRAGYEGPESITLLDKGYNNGSAIFGLELGYILSNEISLNLKSAFTHKTVDAIKEANFIDIQGIKFNVIESDLSLRYNISRYYISAGIQFNLIKNMQYSYQTQGLRFNSHSSGVTFGIGYKLNKININTYYFNSFTNVNFENFILLAPIKSLGIYISYILLETQTANNKVKCPRV